MGFILALIAAAIVLVLLGVLVEGLARLLFIGVIVLLVALIYGAIRTRLRRRARTRR
jgi:hypothetical protein